MQAGGSIHTQQLPSNPPQIPDNLKKKADLRSVSKSNITYDFSPLTLATCPDLMTPSAG
jgi:hypothetical protein